MPRTKDRNHRGLIFSVGDLAERWGIKTQNAKRIMDRVDSPEELDETAAGKVWHVSAIKELEEKHPELKARVEEKEVEACTTTP